MYVSSFDVISSSRFSLEIYFVFTNIAYIYKISSVRSFSRAANNYNVTPTFLIENTQIREERKLFAFNETENFYSCGIHFWNTCLSRRRSHINTQSRIKNTNNEKINDRYFLWKARAKREVYNTHLSLDK